MTQVFKYDDEYLGESIKRQARSAPNDQWLREFVVNSIEGIRSYKKHFPDDKDYSPEIVVDQNLRLLELDDLSKISIIDNGIGMNPDDMVNFLHLLGRSGADKKDFGTENFGLGAKISSVTRSPLGVIYQSWESGKSGFQVTMHWDNEKGAPGVKRVGDYYYKEIDDEFKPDIIKNSGHGTIVTLLGEEYKDDTMDPDFWNIKGIKEVWIANYLNKRFYQFPENIKVSSRNGYFRDNKWDYVGTTEGLKKTLEKNKISNGSVELSDAKINWWILNNDRPKSNPREFVSGHTAIVFEDEVFDITLGNGNKSRLFDITLGNRNIVLHINPKGKKYHQDQNRRNVYKDSEEPPYEEWAAEWVLPKEISDYVNTII
ncbi:hypothetical protein OAK52_00005, partial [Chloroflexi bacterium]|nr:hypothetical protein [Chloroflexota bacterium]